MSDFKLDLSTGSIDCYLATPDRPSPFPAVIVLHEAFGLNDDIRSIADRLGRMGYLACAPDLVEGGRMACIARAFRDLQRGSGPTPDLAEELVDWLGGRDDVDRGAIGAIGFCMGGGFAFLLGLTGKVAAVAPNYGQPPSDLDELIRSCPVVASYGGRDLVFRRHARPVAQRLRSAGVPADVKTYSASGHSFMNRSEGHRVMKAISYPLTRNGYRAEDAEDAWQRIERFFSEHLGQA